MYHVKVFLEETSRVPYCFNYQGNAPNIFFLDWFFPVFSLLCAAVNFDFIIILINLDFILCNSNFNFILYYNLLLCFIQLEMHVRLICAIKILLTYLLT